MSSSQGGASEDWSLILILAESLSSPDPAMREQALYALEKLSAAALLRDGVAGSVGRWTQIPTLVQSLANADPALRERALAALAKLVVKGLSAVDEDWAEVLELLETLAAADPAVQAWATDALEKLLASASSRDREAEIMNQIQKSAQSLNAADTSV